MSHLRKQLESGRGRHRRARYPGDLAAELLSPRLPWKSLAVQGGILAAAVAAVVLLAMRLSSVPVEIEPGPASLAAAEPNPGVALVFPALTLPRAPEHFAAVETPSLSFAVPRFPAPPGPADSKPTTKETT